MKYIDALNILIARGVTAELVAATMTGESLLILTDEPTPAMELTAHVAYAVSEKGVIEGSWVIELGLVAVRWNAQPYEAMMVAFEKLHFNEAGLLGLNNRLDARLKAMP